MNKVIFLLLIILISACDSGVEWEDKPYQVIWIDTGSNRTLNFQLSDNAFIGRVEAEVIAVGSNEQYVVAKQKELGGTDISYYDIERAKDDKYYNWDDITQGPYSEEAFQNLQEQLGLPEFTQEF